MSSEVVSPYLTIKELTEYLKISRGTVHNYVKMGVLKKCRLYKSVRFKREEVDKAVKDIGLR